MSFHHRIIAIWSSILAFFAPRPQLAPVLVQSQRRRRAATFIEYALLAGIALVLFFLFRTALSDIFTSLFTRVRDALS